LRKFLLVTVAALSLSATARAEQIFDFSYTYADGNQVTGSFMGTASGNLVSGLSDISVSFNGTPFINNGSLFGSSFDAAGNWQTGGAVASFDGTGNDFLFIDTNYPVATTFSEYFYSLDGSSWFRNNGYTSLNLINNGNSGQEDAESAGYGTPYNTGTWALTAESTVPEPTSLALLGASMIGLGAVRRRKRA